jgi:hypothetical protein
MRVEGTGKVEATDNDERAVEDAEAVSGHSLPTSAAVEAVKKFRYQPGGGKTIQIVRIEFVLPH